MTDDDALDRYFTEQMVGGTLVVAMGPSGRRPARAPHGVALDLPGGKVELIGLALRSMQGHEPLQALAGRPFALPALVKARRGLNAGAWGTLLVLLLAGWSALMWWALPWLQR